MKMKRDKKMDEYVDVEVMVDGVGNKTGNKTGNKRVGGGKEMIKSVSKNSIRKTYL